MENKEILGVVSMNFHGRYNLRFNIKTWKLHNKIKHRASTSTPAFRVQAMLS